MASTNSSLLNITHSTLNSTDVLGLPTNNTDLFGFPANTTESPESKVVWPPMVEIGVPLLCVITFIGTLVVIYLKPSKPGDSSILQACFPDPDITRSPESVELMVAADGTACYPPNHKSHLEVPNHTSGRRKKSRRSKCEDEEDYDRP